MNTTTPSTSAESIKAKILNSKGQFVKASWKSNAKPAAAFKDVLLEKHTVAVVRAGIDYSNLAVVKEGIASGERGEVGELPWGSTWKIDSEGNSMFPYVLTKTDSKTGEVTDYYRLYPSVSNRAKSVYFVNGEEVTKDVYATYLTPSDAKKILNPSSDDTPLCFTIKAQNVLGIYDEE